MFVDQGSIRQLDWRTAPPVPSARTRATPAVRRVCPARGEPARHAQEPRRPRNVGVSTLFASVSDLFSNMPSRHLNAQSLEDIEILLTFCNEETYVSMRLSQHDPIGFAFTTCYRFNKRRKVWYAITRKFMASMKLSTWADDFCSGNNPSWIESGWIN